MLLRMDPFREFDRLFEAASTGAAPRSVPMDAVREGDHVRVAFDLPGVDPDSIDLTVERNQLTLVAERQHERREGQEWLVAERPVGRFTRQLFLGDNLDADRLEATYVNGVLEVRIPVAEQAKPRRISVGGGSGDGSHSIEATSTES